MRSLVLAAFLLALSGCTDDVSVTLEQQGLAAASGKDSKTLDCRSGDGNVVYEVQGTAGHIKIQVDDADSGEPAMEQKDLRGIANGEVDGLEGASGSWTLTVDRSDFSGSYKVTLSC